MKKNILAFIISLIVVQQLSAQCSIIPSCNTGTVGLCTLPAPYSNLTNAFEGILYNEVIQMSVGSIVPGYTISNVQINTITGLPAGVNYTTNPANGIVPSNSDACILLSGIPMAGSVGNYTISASLIVMTNAGPFPGSASWQLNVGSQFTGCLIAPTCSVSFAGYCTTPLENTFLPNTNELATYSSDIQISLGTMINGMYPINNATLTSISGLPSGLNYSVNPSIVINGGSNACININGQAALGSAGNYTLTGNVLIGSGPSSISAPPIYWYLNVGAPLATAVRSFNQSFEIYLFPNPASSELTVTSSSHLKSIQLLDALGNVVISQDLNYINQKTIEVSSISKGIYFLKANDGSSFIIRKFIKE